MIMYELIFRDHLCFAMFDVASKSFRFKVGSNYVAVQVQSSDGMETFKLVEFDNGVSEYLQFVFVLLWKLGRYGKRIQPTHRVDMGADGWVQPPCRN